MQKTDGMAEESAITQSNILQFVARFAGYHNFSIHRGGNSAHSDETVIISAVSPAPRFKDVRTTMLVENLLEELGYADSPFFLKKGTKEFATASGVGHVLRAATKPECSLLGVYTLNDPENAASTTAPVVYVCKAKTETTADEIHRLVWNQDIVPFLIVYTPVGVKFYSGFEYAQGGTGHLSKLLSFNEACRLAKEFHADEINSGRLWSARSKDVKPDCRVNWKLLDNLKNLDKHLQQDHGLEATVWPIHESNCRKKLASGFTSIVISDFTME